jgi:tetratricopeptide (TPR) repeat protein
MSRFNDETKMWFEKGEDDESLSQLPAVEARRPPRRPPYLLLGVATLSLAGACTAYVMLKLNRQQPAPVAAPIAIHIEHTTEPPAPPTALEPKATEPAPVPQAAVPAIEAAPAEPEPSVPARPTKGKKARPVITPEIKAAESSRPSASPDGVRKADELLKRGQSHDALAAYQAIIAREPANTLALRGACLSLDRLGRVNDAARVCRRALGLADDRDTRAVLARIYHSGGAYQWAANEWRRLLSQNPRDPEARRGLRLAKAKL